jgi:hypothetical protein
LKKLYAIVAAACLAPLMWSDRASAQATYSLAVSRHPSVFAGQREEDIEQRVDKILAAASAMLQRADKPQGVACNVTLKRSGPVRLFASANTPEDIKTKSDRDAVHQENFDSSIVNVKIVNSIGYCRPGAGVFRGCSWPHRFQSIIVTADSTTNDAKFPELLWPHEFGHLTGLWHGKPFASALMSPCALIATNVEVRKKECDCLLAGPGPGACNVPEPSPPVTCPNSGH